MSNWGHLSETDNVKFDELCDKYLPACDKANTLGGEKYYVLSIVLFIVIITMGILLIDIAETNTIIFVLVILSLIHIALLIIL